MLHFIDRCISHAQRKTLAYNFVSNTNRHIHLAYDSIFTDYQHGFRILVILFYSIALFVVAPYVRVWRICPNL